MIDIQLNSINGNVIFNNNTFSDDILVREIGYSKNFPGYFSPIMKRNVFVLHYVLSGKGLVCGVPFNGPGGFLFSSTQDQFYTVDEDSELWEHYWLMFDGLLSKKYLEQANFKTDFHIFKTPYIKNAACIFDNFIKNVNENHDISLKMLSIFFEILSLNVECYGDEKQKIYSRNHYVQNAISMIRTSYDQSITADDISQHVNISSKHLCKLFKNETGFTPIEYLNKHRIYMAAKLLMQTNLSITDIATSTGFYDPNYFSLVFKKNMNLTPSEYRKSTVKSEN